MTTLSNYVDARLAESPAADRIELLRPLAEAVAANPKLDLVFICTHNSRRSHLAQIWARTAARHFGFTDLQTFSGGTEATAFNPRAVAALERAGFTIERLGDGDNPHYRVRAGDDLAMDCFSKRFGDVPNPQRDFAAVMTCSDADRACPLVPGAALRFAIAYVDPKLADGTLTESATYDERCAQIATEMLWVMREAAARR
ncbi:MAG: protein-tyrosine-phosphatase [Planctomycetes bacterium]|nr:protein-tyrosine-phosphatase [Planctomycetota bacterium]